MSKLVFENDAIRNRISNDFDKQCTCQQSAINKPAMNYRTILITAVFHFVHQVEKDSLKHHKMTQDSAGALYTKSPVTSLRTVFSTFISLATSLSGLKVRWFNGSVARLIDRFDGSTDRWFVSWMDRWFDGSMDRWFAGSMDRWFDGLVVQWFDGSMVR